MENSNKENIVCVIEKMASVKNEVPQGGLEPENQSKRAIDKEKDIRENWSRMYLVKFGTSQGLKWKFTMTALQNHLECMDITIRICNRVNN